MEFIAKDAKTCLTTRGGLGKELCDLLRKKLAVPDGVRVFSVHFSIDDIVIVRCEYGPRVPDVPMSLARES